MDFMNPKDINTHETFSKLFPMNEELLGKIEEDMRENGYDISQPIILATWSGQEQPVCIDGHTRLEAAVSAEIDSVPVFTHELDTEDEAVEKAIRLQSKRRNMSDGDIMACISVLDERRKAGRPKKELAQHCANYPEANPEDDSAEPDESAPEQPKGKSSETTGELLNISARKVEQARTVLNQGDPETLEAVKLGEISINKAYKETQKKRKKSDPIEEKREEVQEDTAAEEDNAEPEEKSCETEEEAPSEVAVPSEDTTVRLLPKHYKALVKLGGAVDDHVACAVDMYLQSETEELEHQDLAVGM